MQATTSCLNRLLPSVLRTRLPAAWHGPPLEMVLILRTRTQHVMRSISHAEKEFSASIKRNPEDANATSKRKLHVRNLSFREYGPLLSSACNLLVESPYRDSCEET